MKYSRFYKNTGFSHVILICVITVFSVVGLAGYKVFTVRNDATDSISTQGISPENEHNSDQTPAAADSQQPVPPPIAPSAPGMHQVPPPNPPAVTTPAPTPSSKPVFTTQVKIVGDEACQTNTLDALKLLSEKAPIHYTTVQSHIGIIQCTAQGSGMFAYENPPLYKVGDATRNAGTIWYASTIAHDAGHSKLYRDYLSNHPGESVPGDVWTGESAERACLDAQYDALSKIGGSQSQLDYVENIINSQYYNIPYDQRWW